MSRKATENDFTVDFELGEDVRDESRLKQDANWAKAISDGRTHISHREFSVKHSQEFQKAILDYYTVEELVNSIMNSRNISLFRCITPEVLRLIVDFAFAGQGLLVIGSSMRRNLADCNDDLLFIKQKLKEQRRNLMLTNSNNSAAAFSFTFKICARKRPLLPIEILEGCYDSCDSRSISKGLTLHDGKLARNGRLLHMTHRSYVFDEVFDESVGNFSMCQSTIDPLLQFALSGRNATLLCFGQTGTGKTYTLIGALKYIAMKLVNISIELTFYEIHGKKCYDLLNNRASIKLLSDENDCVHAKGALSLSLSSASGALWKTIEDALTLRSSKVTERNPVSSRSHAVCTMKISSGKLTLVDLAGSERNYETITMNSAQHRESADINISLMALKDCFRAYQSHLEITKNQKVCSDTKNGLKTFLLPRIPYRAHLLTRVLKDCFTIGLEHRTVIIATVSPSPIDLQHSINTLDHSVLMSLNLSKLTSYVTVEVPKTGVALSDIPVENWSSEQVNHWLAIVDAGKFKNIVLPEAMDGAGLLELNAKGLAALFGRDLRTARQAEEGTAWVLEGEESKRLIAIGNALWMSLRRENQIAVNKKSKNVF